MSLFYDELVIAHRAVIRAGIALAKGDETAAVRAVEAADRVLQEIRATARDTERASAIIRSQLFALRFSCN